MDDGAQTFCSHCGLSHHSSSRSVLILIACARSLFCLPCRSRREMDIRAWMTEMGGKPEDLNFEPPLDNGQLGPIQDVLRTPEERFQNLPDYNFEPNYFESKSH